MKVAVLSDIHANIQALDAVLCDCKAFGVEKFWLLGDYVDYGASAVETIETLQRLGAEYILAGNHDACLFDTDIRSSVTPHGHLSHLYTKKVVNEKSNKFEWLKDISGMPQKLISDRRILLIHGTPQDPYWGKFSPKDDADELFEYMSAENIKVIFMGHSHLSFMLTKNGLSIINPGSVGQPRNGNPNAQYVIFEDEAITFRSVKYDIQAAAQQIEQAGLPEYLYKRLYKGV